MKDATTRHRVGMHLRNDLLDRADRRLVDARSAVLRHVSRTKLTEIALERILQLGDAEFFEAMREPIVSLGEV